MILWHCNLKSECPDIDLSINQIETYSALGSFVFWFWIGYLQAEVLFPIQSILMKYLIENYQDNTQNSDFLDIAMLILNITMANDCARKFCNHRSHRDIHAV